MSISGSLESVIVGERTWQFGWDCGCGQHHSLISRWYPTLWDQCPVSGIWYRLEEHEAIQPGMEPT